MTLDPSHPHDALAYVAAICAQLIRFDTTNTGDDTGPGEREAAEWIAAYLAGLGCEVELIEPEPRRTSVITRIAGADPSRPALVLHGHTDVVPAHRDEWQVDPFAGEIRDGVVWGRGAVDMKGMDAMILAVLGGYMRSGRKPARDLIVAFFADEEAGGRLGSRWIVDHRPDLFEGATEAISEVGGFSVDIAGHRAYLLQTAEKHMAWIRLSAKGRGGHGSAINLDNAVTKLTAAVARIGNYQWPLSMTPVVDRLLAGVAELSGQPYERVFTDEQADGVAGGAGLAGSDGAVLAGGAGAGLVGGAARPDPGHIAALMTALGSASKFVGATLSNTANPTMLRAGYKTNVIPGQAQATIDARWLPGHEVEALATLRELAGPEVRVEIIHEDISVSAPFAGPLVDAMIAALHAEDPDAPVLPYLLAGGTDNKALSRLGIRGYGFAPLQLPADMDFTGMFHGVDERVPISALEFGVRVLDRLLATC